MLQNCPVLNWLSSPVAMWIAWKHFFHWWVMTFMCCRVPPSVCVHFFGNCYYFIVINSCHASISYPFFTLTGLYNTFENDCLSWCCLSNLFLTPSDCPDHLQYDFNSGECLEECPCGFIGFDYHLQDYCEPGTLIFNYFGCGSTDILGTGVSTFFLSTITCSCTM